LDQWPLLSWMVVERLMKKLFESPITFLESFDQDADVFPPSFSLWRRSTDLWEAGGSSKEFAGHGITLEARICRER
jgi:hypothetical protein